VESFGTAAEFLDSLTAPPVGCLLLDIQLPGMAGPELQTCLAKRGMSLPIIFLSGTADVEIATTVMKHGATDLLQKPYKLDALLAAVRNGFALDEERRQQSAEVDEARRYIATLTPREHEVAECVAKGYGNKQIAFSLGVSERTVEIHRARVMSKMGIANVPDFVRRWEAGRAAR
jgi:two-component system response regulator FixJ